MQPSGALNTISRVGDDETVQLKVRMELEHERLVRTQVALDESEKKQVALKRELDTKTRQCEDLVKQLMDTKEKSEHRLKQVRTICL